MNYLITAAGIGSRFLKEGIKSPKPLIKVFGNELLIWSLNSFNISSSDKVFIVTLKQHKVKEKIGDKINNIYPDVPVFWFEMEELQNGQLFSTIKAIRFFDIKGAITIHNCDTFHKFDDYEINNFLKNDLFGIIPCFEGDGNHWSFVRTSSIDSFIAIEVSEKKRISNNCSVGTYVFSSASTLIDLFKDYINSNKFSEEYLSVCVSWAWLGVNNSKEYQII